MCFPSLEITIKCVFLLESWIKKGLLSASRPSLGVKRSVATDALKVAADLATVQPRQRFQKVIIGQSLPTQVIFVLTYDNHHTRVSSTSAENLTRTQN